MIIRSTIQDQGKQSDLVNDIITFQTKKNFVIKCCIQGQEFLSFFPHSLKPLLFRFQSITHKLNLGQKAN